MEVLKSFPDGVKEGLGYKIHLLQIGEDPLDSKPIKTIGPGVFELRDRDGKTWYRVIYYTKIKEVIYILHCFTKSTNKTPQNDLNLARNRLRILNERIKKI